MSANQQDKVLVACPHCGHQQAEPRTAISTVCKKCHGHVRLEERELFPLVEQAMPEAELQALGLALERAEGIADAGLPNAAG